MAPLIRLEVGSGENPHEGYEHADVRPGQPHQDYVCPAWAIPLPDRSCEEIMSNHMLEHLTQAQGQATLLEWYRLLAPGGRLLLFVPDLAGHIRQWSEPGDSPHAAGVSNRVHAMAGFYGWQRFPEDSHQWGYDYPSLETQLARIGYRGIVRLPNHSDLMLDVEAFKP